MTHVVCNIYKLRLVSKGVPSVIPTEEMVSVPEVYITHSQTSPNLASVLEATW